MERFTLGFVISSLEEAGSIILGIVLVVVLLQVIAYVVLHHGLKARLALPLTLLVPAAVGLAVLTGYPLLYNVWLAFTNMSLQHISPHVDPDFGVGQFIANIRRVFTRPVLHSEHFFPVFGRTVAYTALQVTFHVSIGLFLAMCLNRRMKLRGIYRTLILIPWAIPQIVAVLTWRTEFHFQYGFVNILLRNFGHSGFFWLSDRMTNWIAFNLVNIWLGVPFMSVILLGGLQSIDPNYYEAAEIDGATWRQRFRNITLPMIRPVLTPAAILGWIWTFNMFNVPYFINARNFESSDILVTALFRAAFEYNRYGFAAAFSIVVFVILLIFTVFYVKISGLELTKKASQKMK